jgi:hypothetical protein
MPRFHLHVVEGDKITRDEEGQECVSADEARAEAEAVVREILATALTNTPPKMAKTIQLTDDAGKAVVTISMRVETTRTEASL